MSKTMSNAPRATLLFHKQIWSTIVEIAGQAVHWVGRASGKLYILAVHGASCAF
jgi:hypothetical protein